MVAQIIPPICSALGGYRYCDRCQSDLPAPPEVTPALVVHSDWLESALKENGIKLQRVPMDGGVESYRIYTLEDWLKVIKWDNTDRYKFSKFRDCDKFAGNFWGRIRFQLGMNSLGFIDDYSSAHAYCLFVTADRVVRLLETQNDRSWPHKETKGTDALHKMESGLVLI